MSETQTLRQPVTGEPKPQSPAATSAPPKKRKIVLPILLLAGLGVGGTLGWNWWSHGRFMLSTDDAYVRADITQIAAKVSGYVTELPVGENAFVKAGTLLARIDNGDYKLAREAVLGKIATQQATVDRLESQKAVQQATIAQAQAQISSAMAETRRTSADYQRYFQLAKQGTISQQRADTALSDRDRATATLRSAQAALVSAEAAIGVLDAQKLEAIRQLEQMSTDVAKADRDIGFTEIRAPVDGIVGNRGVELGGFVNAGGRIAALVATQSLHVEANLKETQVRDVRVGQEVRVHVDALPDHDIIGRVESVAPASGATFSLLPPENATGNFTKIVQRVPVRIALPHDAETLASLRAGLSVVIEIDKRDAGNPAALAQLAQH
ncbi:HlyD family secretion protein [Lacibacterium aquatile]|uniref:HlyD family secretion protein n=1 Tax=Lacibacterium aquatile TaxID=1168082 RepID=A0ABW5DJX3_9PROT